MTKRSCISYLFEEHQCSSVKMIIREALPKLFYHLFIEFEAMFLYLFNDLTVEVFVNVFESSLRRYCPA